MSIKDILYFIYKWIENSFENDICRNLQRSKNSYKKLIYEFIESNKEQDEKLGGEFIKIQVDETAICRGFLKKYFFRLFKTEA